MLDKILKFKKSAKAYYERVNRRCDDGDYAGALSSLLYASKSDPKNVEILCHIADVYTELGMYENAIIYWFKFLSKCRKADMIDGYNGLGANFFFIDDLETAGYYFNKQLSVGEIGDCVYDDILDDYVEAVSSSDKPSFKVLSDKDDSGETHEESYLAAVKKNKAEDYISAIKYADEVPKNSKFYCDALYEKANALFYLDRVDEAIKVLEEEIDLDEGDFNAYNLLFICFGQVDCGDDGEVYYQKFCNFDTDDVKKLNSKMLIFCDFGYYDKALEVANKILRLSPEDANCTYLKGLILYNKGDLEQSVANLKKAYFYSLNPVALHYMRIAENALEKGKRVPKRLPFIFELQKAEVEKRLELIKKLFIGEVKLSSQKTEKILDIMDWCFSSKNQTAQMALAVVTAKSKKPEYIDFIKEEMINPTVTDDAKQRLLALLTEIGAVGSHEEYSVVYSNVFKKIKVCIPNYGADVSVEFRQAYAYAVGRTSLYFDGEMKKLTAGAIELESDMRKSNAFSKFTDMRVLACAMFVYSGINRISDYSAIYGFFDTKREDVENFITYIGANKK